MVYVLFGINDGDYVDYVGVFMATVVMMVMMIGDGHCNEDLKRGFNSDRCDLVKSKPKSRGQAGSYTVPNINLSTYIQVMIELPSYCNEEPSRHHGPCDEEEDEEVDVDANGEDEEDGEQRERDDDLPHHSGGFWPLPPFKS